MSGQVSLFDPPGGRPLPPGHDLQGYAFVLGGGRFVVTGLAAASGYVTVTRTDLATGVRLETCRQIEHVRAWRLLTEVA